MPEFFLPHLPERDLEEWRTDGVQSRARLFLFYLLFFFPVGLPRGSAIRLRNWGDSAKERGRGLWMEIVGLVDEKAQDRPTPTCDYKVMLGMRRRAVGWDG